MTLRSVPAWSADGPVRPWTCQRCLEPQVTWGMEPANLLCHCCQEAAAGQARSERDAGIPGRYRGLTRESWELCFRRRWPSRAAQWSGEPPWLALWGPTGTGKTGLATVLLAERLRAGRLGRWVSAAALAEQLRGEIRAGGNVLATLRVTGLLVLDEPVIADATPWYWDRLSLLCRARDEEGLPTIVTMQLDPNALLGEPAPAPPALVSRWLSGLRVSLTGDDVRLRESA